MIDKLTLGVSLPVGIIAGVMLGAALFGLPGAVDKDTQRTIELHTEALRECHSRLTELERQAYVKRTSESSVVDTGREAR